MPLLTPSRMVVIAISLSLLTFLWTLGLPRELPQPVIPAHHGQQAPHNAEKPAASPALHGEPEQAHEHRTSFLEDAFPTSTPIAVLSSSPSIPTIPMNNANPSGKPVEEGKGGDKAAGSPAHSSSKTAVPPFSAALNGTHTNTTTPQTSCRDIHGASDIMVIVKTSKAELHDRIPAQLDTLLACAPHFALFSDHAGGFRNYTVHDALAGVADATRAAHDEFKDYEKQKQEDVRLNSVSKDLDRWKVLPMLYKAYQLRPSARFFVVIEPDTSLSWTNLAQWTSRLDSRIAYYAGAPLQAGDTKFVQRSPGILLSNAALRQFKKAYDELYKSHWEPRVARESASDIILATAMLDAQVELYNAHPILQANTPESVSWDRKYWCTPAVSWQRMAPQHIEEAWGAEKNWTSKHGWNKPRLQRDAFYDLVEERLVGHADEWDNGSEGTVIAQPLLDNLGDEDSQEWFEENEDLRQAVQSWENCQKVCELVRDCLQWRYSKKGQGECTLGKNIKLGASAPKKEGAEMWVSGWIEERIYNTTSEWECKEPSWRWSQ